MDFWRRMDELIASHEIVIDRPKESVHPRYPNLIYPLDYGYLAGTSGGDGNEIDVWRGSMDNGQLVGVVCTVDTLKNDTELKLLIGCTDSELDIIYSFHNYNEYMSGIIIKRE